MSQLGITTDLIINRTSWTAELRAAENDVKSLASKLGSSPLKMYIAFDKGVASTSLQALVANLQTLANSKPIVIPVTYGMPSGTPGGGGGFPMGASSPNWSMLLNQQANQIIGGLQPTSSPNWSYLLGRRGAGGGGGGGGTGGGGMFGVPGLRSLGTLGAAHFAASSLSAVAEEVGEGYSFMHALGGDDELGAHRSVTKQSELMRAAIEKEHSGLRGAVNWAYGKVGLQPTYTEERKRLDEADREYERVDAREAQVRKAATQRTATREMLHGMETTAIRGEQGGFAGRRSEIGEALRKHNEAAQHIEDAWQQLGYRTYQEAQGVANKVRSTAGRIASAQGQAVARQEFGAVAGTAFNIAGIGNRAAMAEMVATGRGAEANYVGQRQAIADRLTRLGIAYNSETDPERRKLLGQEYQAQYYAGGREETALKVGMYRETYESNRSAMRRGRIAELEGAGYGRQASLYAQTSAIDERLRKQKEEVDRTQDPTVKHQLELRYNQDAAAGAKEKAAVIAEDWRKTLDAIAGYTIQKDQAILATAKNDGQQQLKIFDETTARLRVRMKDRSAEEKKAFEEARGEERKTVVEQQREQHVSMRQQARDIMLRARGQGGLADALDIEDEFRANARAAGKDPRAKQDAINLAKAQVEAYIRGQWKPQMFNSWAGFDQAAQMNILNRDARGLARVKRFAAGLNNLRSTDDLTSNSEGFGPEDVGAFNAATGKLDQAADKLLNNRLAVVAF
jgi:hypothetical protein